MSRVHAAGLLALLLPNLLSGSTACAKPASKAEASRPAPKPVFEASSFRFEADFRDPVRVEGGAPIALTASDGSGLRLVSLDARGVVEDPLSFTELHLVFENPEARVREGQFTIRLPEGASVSRFAMKVGEQWQEGEVVEKQRARAAYEDFLHRRQDPALLEQAAGNEFSGRVFPIPASGRKEIILSYSAPLPSAEAPYRIPLLGLPAVDSLDIQVQVGASEARPANSSLGGSAQSREVVSVHQRAWVPDQDLIISRPAVAGRAGLRSGELLVTRVSPDLPITPDPVHGLFVLVDTSASRGLNLGADLAFVEKLSQGLAAGAGRNTPLAVASFDQTVTMLYEGKAGEFKVPAEGLLPLGASDLSGALRWLKGTLQDLKGFDRVLIVSDGVATAGETDPVALRAAVAALGGVGVQRLDALASGGLRDGDALSALVTAGLPRDGVVLDADKGVRQAASRLERATKSGIKVEIPGAEWIWPEQLDGVQTGDEVLVYAAVKGSGPVQVKLDGAARSLPAESLAPVERPLMERAAAEARIDRLGWLRDTRFADDKDLREAMRQEALNLALRHRILSGDTAMLVLETEADYARFNIDRKALADILVTGPSGVEVLNRTGLPVAPLPVVVEKTERVADKSKEAKKSLESSPSEVQGFADDLPMDADGAAPEEVSTGEALEALGYTASEGPPPPAPPPPPPAMAAPAARPAPQRVVVQADRIEAREDSAESVARTAMRRPERDNRPEPLAEEPLAEQKVEQVSPWTGPFKDVMDRIAAGDRDGALSMALAWRAEAPGDVLALLALGECYEAKGDLLSAARAYGSLIDLFPSRADLRRLAGNRLDRLADGVGLPLAADTYRAAVDQRPDHPSSHRMLAYALLRAGQPEAAFEAIAAGASRSYPDGRFRGVDRILKEDAGLIAAAWLKAEPGRRGEILERLAPLGARLPDGPSLRFVLSWETDANDVDFHIIDRKGNHAYYSSPRLASGGELYADVTTGYGPECFTVPGKATGFPYTLQAHYYSRGPMGFGMGKLEIIDFDGQGGLRFEERPFIVMQDGAFVALGEVKGG